MSRILIIDDDAPTCQMVGEFLRRQGHTVNSATDGTAGLAMAAVEAPDLILCDLNMPGMNGQEVVTALRRAERSAEIPVIFLSGCTDHQEIRRTMNLGADDFLNKPVKLHEVLEAVNARLALRQQKQQRESSRLEAAVNFFAGIIHDLENSAVEKSGGRPGVRGEMDGAGSLLEQVRERLYPAKGSTEHQVKAAFLARSSERQQLVKLSEVKLLQAYGEYSKAFWGKDQHMLMRKPLKSWQLELPENQFVRVHRQAIVNLVFLEQVAKTGGKLHIHLRDFKEIIPVSQRCAPQFNRRLKMFEQTL